VARDAAAGWEEAAQASANGKAQLSEVGPARGLRVLVDPSYPFSPEDRALLGVDPSARPSRPPEPW
jgi:hypothetical protein